MNTATPYLNYPGTCEEAFELYRNVFNGNLGMINRFKDMPPEMQVPEGYGDKVMHMSLEVDGKVMLLGSDAPEGFGPPFNAGNNISLYLDAASEAEAQRVFEALGEGGQVGMPLEPTFWAALFGMVTDRYGINWMISYGEPRQA